MSGVDLLGKAFEITVYLGGKEKTKYSELYREFVLKSSSLRKALRQLLELGLIKRPTRGCYTLTSKGAAVSTYLRNSKLELSKVAKASNSKLKRAIVNQLTLELPQGKVVSLQKALVNLSLVSERTMTPLYKALGEMEELGFVKKVERGRYSLTEAGYTLFDLQAMIWLGKEEYLPFPKPLKQFLDSESYSVANGFWCVQGFLDYESSDLEREKQFSVFKRKFLNEMQKFGFFYRLTVDGAELFQIIEPNLLMHILLSPGIHFIIHVGVPCVSELNSIEGGEVLSAVLKEEFSVTRGAPHYYPRARGFELPPYGVGPYAWSYCIAKEAFGEDKNFQSSEVAIEVGVDSFIVATHNVILNLLRNVTRKTLLELGYKQEDYEEQPNSFTSVWERKSFFEIRKFSELDEYGTLLIEKYKPRLGGSSPKAVQARRNLHGR